LIQNSNTTSNDEINPPYVKIFERKGGGNYIWNTKKLMPLLHGRIGKT
jgi:hypothetical protein